MESSVKKGGFLMVFLAFILITGCFYSVVYLYSLFTENAVIGYPDFEMDELPVLGSFENLQALMKESYDNQSDSNALKRLMEFSGSVTDFAGAPAAKGDFSETNVQVEGVDEADIVKTDGSYIYQVNKNRVVVVGAYPPGAMEIKSIIRFAEDGFYPGELYLDEEYLVVIGQAYSEIPSYREPIVKPQNIEGFDPGVAEDSMSSFRTEEIMIYPPPYYTERITKIKIFDIADKTAVKEVREIDVEGHYVSSRKIDSALYFVINKNIDYYNILRDDDVESAYGNFTPSYRDTAVSDKDGYDAEDYINITYEEIRYFPDFSEPNYMMVGSIDLNRVQEKVELYTYLGAGENIYASRENLYIALTNYNFIRESHWGSYNDYSTTIYKFALEDGSMNFKEKGDVPGRILNQFSMDEYENYLRIATTTGEMLRTDERTSKNNVYILDNNLKTTGRLEGIAPGESIFAVRYMGEKGYVVTFRTVDPLFVIDLKDPANPQILGELKIPGYSDYLHPYDENHLIGFGIETVEVEQKDHTGRVIGTIALEKGMKMALFDVSDVSNPVEKFNETIGGRGTASSLLKDHRSLLFDRDRNLIVFPVTVIEDIADNGNRDELLRYGRFAFQGAYIYGLDLEEGFDLRGKITHLSGEDQYWYKSDKNIERILFIRDALYTLSDSEIRASSIKSLKKIKSILIN